MVIVVAAIKTKIQKSENEEKTMQIELWNNNSVGSCLRFMYTGFVLLTVAYVSMYSLVYVNGKHIIGGRSAS